MRQLIVLVALAFATPALAAPKSAPSKEQVKAQKQEVRETKKEARQLDRWARKLEKAADRDNARKVARYDAKLDELYRTELAGLRAKGISTREVEEEPMIHPAHPDAVYPEPEPERPKLESLRDTVVALRDAKRERERSGSARVKPAERKLLASLQETVEKRYERKDRRYHEAKARL